MTGHDNPTFLDDNLSVPGDYRPTYFPQRPTKFDPDTQQQTCNDAAPPPNTLPPDKPSDIPPRETWGKGVEFLMSCIAMSVGLGNVWRFPFTALNNGGGAFLIPYLIVLLLVGRPIYYMEMAIGQFSSRGSVKVYDFAPAMRGVGFGQVIAIICAATYYSSVMALIVSYLVDSFKNPLPWTKCRENWINCIDSQGQSSPVNPDSGLTTSSQFYFLNEVLKEKPQIDDGIGLPDPYLTMCLAISWLVVMLVLIKGVKSAGKASYFLALFPYVVLGILLIRSSTLPGAMDGIIYFIKPQWNQLLNPQVWYAAVTQVFFSLSVCFGNVIMYASFNKFDHNIYRDANIVTTLDTFTSLIAGLTIFGILGHLAHEIGTDDVSTVVVSGAGLAFISYPDAIAKFDFLPQMFSVLFFFMLFVLGIGSNVAMASNICTVIRDAFPKVKNWQVSAGVSLIGLALGSVYVTPGGQFILELVDYFGASNIVYVLAIGELIALHYIYGLGRFCRDIEFMIGKRPGIYWRLTWGFITPVLLLIIFIYTLAIYSPLTYRGQSYPSAAYAAGWTLAAFGVLQLPIWAAVAVIREDGKTWREKFVRAFKPRSNWGPVVPAIAEKYHKFRATEDSKELFANDGFFNKIKRTLFG